MVLKILKILKMKTVSNILYFTVKPYGVPQ